MKRDLELIKKILLFSEENFSGEFISVIHPIQPDVPFSEIFDTDETTFRYHVKLLTDYELLESKVKASMVPNALPDEYTMTPRSVVEIGSLTWQGHDFLDDARNDTAWNAAKSVAGKLSFTAFRFALMSKSVAEAAILIKQFLGN